MNQDVTSGCSHGYLAERSLIGQLHTKAVETLEQLLHEMLHFCRQVGVKAKREGLSSPMYTENWPAFQFFPWLILAATRGTGLKEFIILPVTDTFPPAVFLPESLSFCSCGQSFYLFLHVAHILLSFCISPSPSPSP